MTRELPNKLRIRILGKSLLNRVLDVLARSCAWRAYVLACSRAWRAYVLACSRAWRAYVLGVFTCLCARVLDALTCLRACVLTCLACLRACVPTCLVCLYARALLTCFLWCVLGVFTINLLTFLSNYLFCLHKSRLCN